MGDYHYGILIVATIFIIFLVSCPKTTLMVCGGILLLGLAAALYIAMKHPEVKEGGGRIYGGGKSEEEVRNAFVGLFQFPSIGPNSPYGTFPWLGNLELDGYNGALSLAFEFQGPRHYSHHPLADKNNQRVIPRLDPWNPSSFIGAPLTPGEIQAVQNNMQTAAGSYNKFLNAVNNDQTKHALCAQHGVRLLTIPYTATEGKDQAAIDAYVLSRLMDIGVAKKDLTIYVPEVLAPPVDMTEYVVAPLPEWDPNNYTEPIEGSFPPAFRMPGSFRYYKPTEGTFWEPKLVTPDNIPRWIINTYGPQAASIVAMRGIPTTNWGGVFRWLPSDMRQMTVYDTRSGSFQTLDSNNLVDVTHGVAYAVLPKK